MDYSEKTIQRSILDYLALMEKTQNIYFFRAGAGMVKLDSGRFFKTGKPGLSDIVVIQRRLDATGKPYARALFLEVKTAKGRQSEAQKHAEKAVIAAGGEYHIVRSIDNCKAVLEG